MSKRISFISNAKLTSISFGVLLVIFCTIGMSFTPGDEGENVGNPNDTTYVPASGPRKSHWTTSGTCGGTNYHNKTDYAKTIAQSSNVNYGTVAITANSKKATIVTAADGSSSYVEWDTGLGTNETTDERKDLEAIHTNSITFEATPSDPQEYRFAGWYSDAEGKTRVSEEGETPWETDVKFDSQYYTYSTSHPTNYESSNSRWTKTYYAKFEIIPANDVTFLAASMPERDNGSYKVVGKNLNQSITTSNQTIGVKGVTLTATPTEAAVFARWYTQDGSGNKTTLSTENPYNAAFTTAATVGVEWVELSNHHNLTFKAAELDANDNPVGTYTVNSQTVSTTDYVYNTGEAYKFKPTMTATPATGYVFTGWYAKHGKRKTLLSAANPWSPIFTQDSVICAGFAFNDYTDEQKAQFKANGQYFTDLNAANNAAKSASTKTIVCTRDGILPPGNYTISDGVTLFIPYSTSESTQSTPSVVTTAETLSAYRTLTFAEGANVECDGTICVGGKIMSAGGGSKSAYVTGPCGVINMAKGGHIELNGTLACWGFIKGQDMDQGNNTLDVGTITANPGAIVKEDFAVGDWRGGTATQAIYNKRSSWKLFPFQSYSIQNVEVPVTFKYGSSLNTYVVVNGGGGNNPASFDIAGSKNTLFLLKDKNSTVRKWYDPTTDLTCYELSGTAQLDALNITVYISLSSSDYYLPISNSMHIILTGCNMTLSKPITMQAGSVIEIKDDATANLENRMHLFDKDEWGLYIHDYYFRSFNNLTNHKNRGAENSKEKLEDAKLIVDGILNVVSGKGYLYSTNGGANIMGNGGGKVVFGGALPSSGTIHQVNTGSKSESYIKDSPNDINSANLCNEDGSYTKSIASTTFHNVHGRWFAASAKDEKADHTYNFTYISSGDVSGTGGTNTTTDAVYSNDKTGLEAQMKWANVIADGSCPNWWKGQGTQATWFYNWTMNSDWNQYIPMASPTGWYSGSDNHLYEKQNCNWEDVGETDENCLYTIGGVKKALVDGDLVQLEKNAEDEAYHDVANPTNYYICFEGCNWHPATKYTGEEKAYVVEEGNYIWFENNWLNVERKEPFFYSLDETNVPIYYEYENDEWVLASYKVKVVDNLETRRFYFLPEAITVASGKTNTTITILKDITGINATMTYSAKNTTCTLDLNGHAVSGGCASLLTINASGSTFTITDNTTEKNGRLENIFEQNAVTYGITLTAGTLNVEHVTIHSENAAQYASKDATVNEVAVKALTSCGARVVQVSAAQNLNIKSGRLEAYATRNAYGIVATGNTANTTVVTISGGEIYAEAPCGAYGISCTGKLNMSGGLVEAKLNDHLVDAAYAADNASNNLNKHQTTYAIIMGGSASATASSCYYGTLTVTGGTIKATSDLVRSYTSNVFGIYMNISVAAMGNRNFASTSKTNAEQACAVGSVKNAEIIVDNKANYGYGIYVLGKYNSKDKTNSVFKVENTNVDVKAYNYAYGVYACGGINGTTGECYTGDVEMTNCTVTAEATTASYAYGALVYAGQTTIYKDKQANYYGEYATAAKMTINGGTITAKAKNHYAYATTTSTRAKTIYNPENSAGTTIGEGKEAYPTLIINGGTYNATTGGYYARGVSSGGNTTISDATFNVTAGSYYAYGLYAVSGKLTATNVTVNNTAKGRVSSSDNNAYAYGVYADCSIISSGNQAWTGYAYASDVELNNCTVTSTATTYNNARGLCVEAKQALLTQANFDKQKTTSSWSDATYNLYASVFPGDNTSRAVAARATVNGGTFTAKAQNATAYGAVSTKTVITNTQEAMASPEMTLNNATFIAKSMNSTSAYGIYSGGPTTIDGCIITATAGDPTIKNTASGVLNVDKVTKIKNSTITATSADAAYGLEGRAEINATHGYCWHGDFDLSEAGNTTITAETKTSGKTAYTIYLKSAKLPIAVGGAFDGDYATAANATINGGTYIAKAAGNGSGYAISLGGQQTQGEVIAQPEVEVLDGFFDGKTAEVGTAGVVGHMQLKGGYFVHPTNLAAYAVAPKSVWTLPNTHEHYDPYKYKIVEHYNVTFKNGSTQLLQNDMEVGSIPAYTGTTPTKAGDAQYSYTFDGWSTTDGGNKLASLPAVSAETTYFAHYNKIVQNYTVSIAANNGEWGNVSDASVTNVPYGTSITTSGNTLTVNGTTVTATPAARDAQYTYTFDHWDASVSVTGATDVQAVFTRTVNTYSVTWKNEDGTPLETDENVAYGTTPTYDGAIPTKAADENNTYTFNGWTPAVGAITGNTEYTAIYSTTPTVASVTTSDGTKYYATVADAITAANGKTNPTMTMLRNASTTEVEITAAMTIDLNGKEITSEETTVEKAVFKITSGEVTITDNGSEGKIIRKANSAGYLYGISLTAGTLDITGGYIYAENTYTTSHKNYRAYGINTQDDAVSVTISGGTIEARRPEGYVYGIYTQNTCSLTVAGGEIIASGNSVVRGIYVKGITELTNATITATGEDSYAIYVGGGETTIHSGLYKAAGKVLYKKSGSASAKGGYYSNDADLAGNCAAHYRVKELADTHPEYENGYRYTVDNLYTVTWKDAQETIKTDEWAYGSIPSFAYEKPQTARYTYTLTGWANGATKYLFPTTLPAVTADATYTAQYNAETRYHTITFVNDDGTTVLQSSDVQWGGQPKYTKATPTTTKTDGIYVFDGWSPDIVVVTEPATYTAKYTKLMNLVVEEGETLNVNTTTSVSTTTIHVAGKLTITSGKTLTTDDLVLEGTPTSSGEIIGNVTAGKAYFDLSNGENGFKARTWYAVAVPWQVAVPAYEIPGCGVSITNDGEHYTQQELGRSFDLIYYDGKCRAERGVNDACWVYVEDDQQDRSEHYEMKPGCAYMIYLTSDAQTIRFERKEGADLLTNTLSVKTYELQTGNGKDANWNGIANPATYHAYINANAATYNTTINAGQIYDAENRTYSVVDLSTHDLVVGQPVFVQATASNPSVAANPSHNATAPYYAPRRVQAQPLTRYDVMFAAVDEDVKERVIIRTDEDKEADEYIVGQDLAKMGVSSVVPQMWINRYDSRMCINTVAPVDNVADYPLGLFVPKNGEYDLFIADQPNSETMLYLTYDGEAIWNLSYGGYVANLEKGTNAHYGLRIVYSAPKVATGIEEATIQNGDAIRKVIINDKVYIIRNGEMYSVDGQMVK